ncbi:MAG: 4-hydroxyphenylpyruvate dioxygenase [Betaproteobacteria bacterium]|nr:4-hydroxyphenylpyruvate dioxygenase [Betaproteobacteria bacterium]MCC6249241.1 4-hydroxyphenylpyruvate dioxygenase [Rubrivivax sp.]MCL4695858.1 4-hydroxyphenylpyruvate dioxygenase [Burkholderiaceae bacterium]
MMQALAREAVLDVPNPLGLEGVEFIEYTTPRPQALGQLLEQVGFRPVARHRSREVLLYRQGDMNVVINAHGIAKDGSDETPQIAAIALRVRDAGAAHRRVVELGAWPVPVKVQPMELHIPGVHGVGTSRVYFIDRWREFSIYDVDFVPIPTVEGTVPALADMHWFGVVQYVGLARAADWCAFYGSLFGFTVLSPEQTFGILPAGNILRSPCGTFFLQLIEPASDSEDLVTAEHLHRVAFGAPDVPAAVRALRERGVDFVEASALHSTARGALTREQLGGVMFELVHHESPRG